MSNFNFGGPVELISTKNCGGGEYIWYFSNKGLDLGQRLARKFHLSQEREGYVSFYTTRAQNKQVERELKKAGLNWEAL